MLKFEGIAVGTTIKAFDFEPCPGRTDRYVVGYILHTTTRAGAKVYAVNCREDSAFPDGANRVGHIVFVPMETVMDFDERVSPVK